MGRLLVNGEVLEEIPRDLYIPPEALEVCLEVFEGPLDLLLYLIRKHNLNILDISMADLTCQYMEYVEKMRTSRIELAAEYLLMSAMLIEIKSRMLLPPTGQEDEEDDPRAELVRRLLEYEALQLAAQKLDAMPQVGRDILVAHVFFEPDDALCRPKVSATDLTRAWMRILRQAGRQVHHQVRYVDLSLREHMSLVLCKLSPTTWVEFSSVFDVQEGLAKLVICFLAILELSREGLIQMTQSSGLAPIYLQAVGGTDLV